MNGSGSIELVKGDITEMETDAIGKWLGRAHNGWCSIIRQENRTPPLRVRASPPRKGGDKQQ
ncbi:hypothetical protein MNBD_NITROSPINAE04-1785 [hydrothermal vent metagenome]|uniref:Uncharacterized protein n=1 Tax=hydrothermal vent metagenome TaxID=652676 RepID=A0A3B1BUA2_9ZZZZ